LLLRLTLALCCFAILSIGLSRDWQLRNEDNGAMHTTLALSHVELGLAQTRAHDLFFNPHTGQASRYGHHPPATALAVAAAFALTGSDSPAVARLTVIVFHLGSVFLLTMLLGEFFGARRALLGGFVMATVPMSAYFGRMVNYEPLCLFAILVQLHAYVRFKRTGQSRDLIWLAVGIVVGGFIDWPSFFFTATLASGEITDVVRRRSSAFRLLAVLVISGTSAFVFDLWHLWYAGADTITALVGVASTNHWQPDFTVTRFLGGQIDTFRRYFTEIGLISVLLVGGCLARPRTQLSRNLFDVEHADVLKRMLLGAGAAAGLYVLTAPSWAMAHQYWQFYFLPVAVTSIALLWALLQRAIVAHPTWLLRGLRVVCILNVLIGSAYWVYFRHSRVEAYAVEATAGFRSTFLTPRSLQGERGATERDVHGQR
jgi:4-amino-4-deoxy-L-arabinose transferase-like glycosyltransferase